MTAPYVICAGNGCMADYEASAELVTNMKKGKGLAVQGINGAGQVISLQLPLENLPRPMTVRRPIRRCSRRCSASASRNSRRRRSKA